MDLTTFGGNKKFITVLSDGKFHQDVPEGTMNSVVREYENRDGEKKQKRELIFDKASGKITKIKFEEGKFGKNIQIEIDGDGVISLSTNTSFVEDFMKKLPNINLSRAVTIAPYSFDKDGKNRKGITFYQDGKKIENYYWDTVKKIVANGFPAVEGNTEKFDSDDWKMYFMKVRKFLIGEVEKLINDGVVVGQEEEVINLDDIDL